GWFGEAHAADVGRGTWKDAENWPLRVVDMSQYIHNMTHIVRNKSRKYGSPLRAQQAEETRERILDATGRVMAEGLAFVSIPQVAREAGVSVPTVYRHFATKRDLLAAVYPHEVRRAGLGELVMPRSIDELRGGLRA